MARTASTQDLALAAARAGAQPGWCVVAEEQTAGRGRQGRRWSAPAGSALLVSVLVPAVTAGGWPALAAGLAAAEAVEEACPPGCGHVGLKWPNDLVVSGGKLGGILVEAPGGMAMPLVVGVGLNVAVGVFPDGVNGASLHSLCAPDAVPGREALLAALLGRLSGRFADLAAGQEGIERVSAAWAVRGTGLGRPVVADSPQGRLTGVARGLDADGALLVETAGGVRRLVAGDVHLAG